jgi:transcriptional regulator with XRE-family HTH domain
MFKIRDVMKEHTDSILPGLSRILSGLGERLKVARLRRRYSADMVAQRAGMARATLYRIELGDPGVSLGNYARVMQVLRLEEDLKRLAVDDELGRKLQDAEIGSRARAPRRKSPPKDADRKP